MSSASSHAADGCSADSATDNTAAAAAVLTLPRPTAASLPAARVLPRRAAAVTALAGRVAVGADRCGRGAALAGFSTGATICVTRSGGAPEDLSLLLRLPSSLCASGVARSRGSCRFHNSVAH